jgi:hypothetical protein
MISEKVAFAFFFLFFTCLVHAETEDQLRKNLQKTKDKTSHLQARLHLLSFLEETNKSSWLKELELIEKQALAYNNPKDQKIISLLLCEKAIYLGAFSNAKLNFEHNLKTYIFQSKQLEWRRKLLEYTLKQNKSTQNFKSLLAYSRLFMKNKQSAQLYQIQATHYLVQGQIDSALILSDQSVQIAKRSAGSWTLINALQAQAEVFWRANLLDKAVQRSIFSLQLAEEAQLPYFKIRPLILIAAISLEVGNDDQTIAYAKRAQNLADQYQDDFFRAYSALILSEHYPKAKLLVSDVRPSILKNLEERFKLHRRNLPQMMEIDLTQLPEDIDPLQDQKANLIVCDVPCSGSGTWGRTPEQAYFFDPETLKAFSEKQKAITLRAADFLADDGTIIYITCSVFSAENEENVKSICKTGNFAVLEQQIINGFENQADCLFVAVLKRTK